MLTLCRLAGPVSIRQPESPQLRQFTFFTSRAPQQDGGERLYLHMGYFETLLDAQRWAQAVRGRYPHAIATAARAGFRPSESQAAARPAEPLNGVEAGPKPAPTPDQSLTDSQVMRILETRPATSLPSDADKRNTEQIAVLRPEDTSTRRALKDAVVAGAPVSFAVQLHFSPQPIDLSRIASLASMKDHMLYATENRREGRSSHFLRLGFFADPIAAKQVAADLRSRYPSVAVIPVAEEEIARVCEARRETAAIPYLVQPRAEPEPASKLPPSANHPKPRSSSQRGETLEQTLEQLAQRELLHDPDSLSESGVRHLKVQIEKRKSRRD
jgi:hypothetical protein